METKRKKTAKKPKILKFPDGFLWGSATASYQVEGGISNNDWAQSKMPPAGMACDHYNRYEDDFRIAKKLGMNAQRISLEWSRIEPERDIWDEEAIDHYRRVLEFQKKLGFTTFVTLHHLTLPVWVAKAGGWASKETIKEFAHYVSKVAVSLGPLIDFWITINEPSVHALLGYRYGVWPPFKKNPLQGLAVYRNMLVAHNRAYEMIHGHYPNAQVGFAQNIAFSESAHPKSHWDGLLVRFADWMSITYPYRKTKNDFLGVNYYFHNVYNFWKFSYPQMARKDRYQQTDKGWEIYPEGLYQVLLKLRKLNKPIYIVENGLADERDLQRAQFILDHVEQAGKAVSKGTQVRGYLYWSLLDNYEWPVLKNEKTGYEMKFGLVKVDFQHGLKRVIRPSARVYAEICKTNRLKI